MTLAPGAMFDAIVEANDRHDALMANGKGYQTAIDTFACLCQAGYAGSFCDMFEEEAAGYVRRALASHRPGHLAYLLDAGILPKRFVEPERSVVAQALASAHPAQADALDRARAALLPLLT